MTTHPFYLKTKRIVWPLMFGQCLIIFLTVLFFPDIAFKNFYNTANILSFISMIIIGIIIGFGYLAYTVAGIAGK